MTINSEVDAEMLLAHSKQNLKLQQKIAQIKLMQEHMKAQGETRMGVSMLYANKYSIEVEFDD